MDILTKQIQQNHLNTGSLIQERNSVSWYWFHNWTSRL